MPKSKHRRKTDRGRRRKKQYDKCWHEWSQNGRGPKEITPSDHKSGRGSKFSTRLRKWDLPGAILRLGELVFGPRVSRRPRKGSQGDGSP